jgi:hypothetical protein
MWDTRIRAASYPGVPFFPSTRHELPTRPLIADFTVQGSAFIVLRARCGVHGAWCLVLGVWCWVFGAGCLVLGVWCWKLGVERGIVAWESNSQATGELKQAEASSDHDWDELALACLGSPVASPFDGEAVARRLLKQSRVGR